MLQWLDRTPGQTMSAASANLALDVLIKSNSAIATTLESTEKTKLASVTNEGKDFNYDRDDVSADNEITTKCANFSSLAEQLPVVNIPITDAYSDDDLLRPAKDGLLPSSEKSKPFKYYDLFHLTEIHETTGGIEGEEFFDHPEFYGAESLQMHRPGLIRCSCSSACS